MHFDVDSFVSQCRAANRSGADPINAVRDVVDEAVSRAAEILQVLPASGEEEILLYQSSDLTIYRVLVFQGLQYPPHEHGMPVVLGIYAGCETNLLYTRLKEDHHRIKQIGRIDVGAPQVRVLDGDVIHSVTNPHPEPAAALHVYFGNLSLQKRSLWTLDLDGEQQFDPQSYFARARQLELATYRYK